jgi:hypothetical protein
VLFYLNQLRKRLREYKPKSAPNCFRAKIFVRQIVFAPNCIRAKMFARQNREPTFPSEDASPNKIAWLLLKKWWLLYLGKM